MDDHEWQALFLLFSMAISFRWCQILPSRNKTSLIDLKCSHFLVLLLKSYPHMSNLVVFR